jgi:hypothetical protein
LYEGRNEEDTGKLLEIDSNCDGTGDTFFIIPDSELEGILVTFDKNGDSLSDIVVYDEDRDGAWDGSLYDVDFDGEPDLVGHHPDGKLKPSSFSAYKPT